jgi:hypothetical protein
MVDIKIIDLNVLKSRKQYSDLLFSQMSQNNVTQLFLS